MKAGRQLEDHRADANLSQNALGELLMSTPALSDGMMYVRAHHHVYAIGR